MARIKLDWEEARGDLPMVCAFCGDDADELVTAEMKEMGGRIRLGYTLHKSADITLPRCRRHADSWITMFTIHAKWIEPDYVELNNCPREFVDAVEEFRDDPKSFVRNQKRTRREDDKEYDDDRPRRRHRDDDEDDYDDRPRRRRPRRVSNSQTTIAIIGAVVLGFCLLMIVGGIVVSRLIGNRAPPPQQQWQPGQPFGPNPPGRPNPW